MPKATPLVVSASLLVAACSTINPQIGQLETFKQEAAARNWQAIADTRVACAPESQGCAQSHQIKADACMSLGNNAPSAQQAAEYDCAITEYQAAVAAQLKLPDPAIDLAVLQKGELEALLRRRDHSRSDREATPFNRALLTEAATVVKAAPAQAAGYYYLGDALVSQALSEQPPTSCETLHRAAATLAHASQQPGGYADAITQRRRDIANAAQAGGCKL
nr:hypothetical protein [uncultured Rhodopila sp.]